MGNEGSSQKIGYNENNPLFVATIDQEGYPHYYDVVYSQGTGVFGEELTVIESIAPIEISSRDRQEAEIKQINSLLFQNKIVNISHILNLSLFLLIFFFDKHSKPLTRPLLYLIF